MLHDRDDRQSQRGALQPPLDVAALARIHDVGVFSISERDKILPVVPMFHANAWGLPYTSVLAGASLVMPGPDMSPQGIISLLESEKVTVAAGVPTIWMGLVPLLDNHDLSNLKVIICGGSAVPKALSEAGAPRSACR